MAKLSSYYTICPLIDQQNLLGVEKDPDLGCAIVTLGRNIVKRYKLQDLKEISNWSSKEHLTSQVVFDPTSEKYVAIFDGKSIRLWSESETTLDNVKKYKFHSKLYKILTLGDNPPVLVNQNGATASLTWALQNRKQWKSISILKASEKFMECQLISINGTTYLCGFTKLNGANNFIFVKLDSNYISQPETLVRIKLAHAEETLVGRVVTQDDNNVYLLTLWSNGRLYSYPLLQVNPSPDPIPGTLVSVISSVSTKYPIVMVQLNETTICMYGANVAEEGAVLAIYNIRFKLTQAIQNLKMYTKEAKLWKVDDKLLLAANKHLAVASFQLTLQKIEMMVGSFVNATNDASDDMIIVQESVVENWEKEQETTNTLKDEEFLKRSFSQLPKRVAKRVKGCLEEGIDDADIQQSLIADLIASKDVSSMIWCLNNFQDLPEKILIDLVLFCLRTPDAIFLPVENGTSESKSSKSPSRHDFLNRILSVANSDMSLLNYMKSSLSFEEVLRLFEYLIEKLDDAEENVEDEQEPANKKLYEWVSLLLDSHYQHYLLSQSPEVLAKLNKLKGILDNHFQLLKDLEDIRPILKRVISKKSLKFQQGDTNNFYSIEEVKLY